mmetsp:Transcript_5539/g.13441  ORF Transcript_5539/g.13441 Transcript_5539/m.13441 type:complete len:204 (-) Transcript_5539:481-1092(-)
MASSETSMLTTSPSNAGGGVSGTGNAMGPKSRGVSASVGRCDRRRISSPMAASKIPLSGAHSSTTWPVLRMSLPMSPFFAQNDFRCGSYRASYVGMALWLCSGSKLPSTSRIIVLPVLVARGFFGAPSGTPDSVSVPLFVGDTDLPPIADPGRDPGLDELGDPGRAEVGRALVGLCDCAEPGRDIADPGRPPEERTEALLSSG